MLEIGNGGMNEDEYKTHMSLWAILAAPLLAGNDLREMSPGIAAILTNREVIAVDQDKEGKQGRRVSKSGDQEIWSRPLSDNEQAVALFNRGGERAAITIKWSELGLKSVPSHVRDLWEGTGSRCCLASVGQLVRQFAYNSPFTSGAGQPLYLIRR
jgi:alpha-galactosidase